MTTEYQVPQMSCQHCVNAITEEVSQVDGVQKVTIDLGSKRVRVDAGTQVPTERIVAAINEAGYDDVTVLN